jgi:hypothetical protein
MTENNGTAGGNEPAYRKVCVSRANAFKASKWLRKNRDGLAARSLTKQQIADECRTGSQIPEMLTGKHIESICTDFGIAPMWVRKLPSSNKRSNRRIRRPRTVQPNCCHRIVERCRRVVPIVRHPWRNV